MSFTERLNKLIEDLGANAKTIAGFAGFDRSQLSRLRTGKLVPGEGSSTIEKLISGIYLYSDNRNGLEELCGIIGIAKDAPAEEIKKKIRSWLFEGTAEASSMPRPGGRSAGRPRKNRTQMKYFSERLDASMNLASLSSVRLSQLLHVDASLISRYRSGVRTPEDNPEIVERLSEILLDRIDRTGHMRELSELMRQPEEEIDTAGFSLWLLNQVDLPEQTIPLAEDLLAFFDSVSPSSGTNLPFPQSVIPSEITDSGKSHYYGMEGLRESVLRFLSAAAAGHAERLMLYSDEDQDWLTSDPSFLARWAALMTACVKNGTRIRIVHNIDRNLEEMSHAIKNWLPLYTSGMIESYYSNKQRDRRFSHTLFLWPDHACIESFHVKGSKESIYHYYTEDPELGICASDFSELMKFSKPLVVIAPPKHYTGRSETYVIQRELTLGSMPEELVKEFDHPLLTAAWKDARALLLRQLENHVLNECITLPSDAELADGSVLTEWIHGMEPLRYTPRQYAMHIGNIITLSERFPTYRFFALPELPFPNMKLLITAGGTQISPTALPNLSFGFTHPLMCKAFLDYAESLLSQYRMDRNSLRHMLEGRFL